MLKFEITKITRKIQFFFRIQYKRLIKTINKKPSKKDFDTIQIFNIKQNPLYRFSLMLNSSTFRFNSIRSVTRCILLHHSHIPTTPI